jgi:hypothetical protein
MGGDGMSGLTSEFVPSAEMPLPAEGQSPPPPPPGGGEFRVVSSPVQPGMQVGIVARDKSGMVIFKDVYKVMKVMGKGRLKLKAVTKRKK